MKRSEVRTPKGLSHLLEMTSESNQTTWQALLKNTALHPANHSN